MWVRVEKSAVAAASFCGLGEGDGGFTCDLWGHAVVWRLYGWI